MSTAAEFVQSLPGSFDDDAVKSAFGPLEQRSLLHALGKCNLTEYPEVSGHYFGVRCSGQMICEKCGDDYYSHPMDWRVIGYGNVPYLNILCDGRRVKL